MWGRICEEQVHALRVHRSTKANVAAKAVVAVMVVVTQSCGGCAPSTQTQAAASTGLQEAGSIHSMYSIGGTGASNTCTV